MMDLVGNEGYVKRMTHVIHGDAKTGVVTVQAFPSKAEAEAGRLGGKYSFVVERPEDLLPVPLTLLKGALKLYGRRAKGRRVRIESEVIKAMADKQKQMEKDESKGKKKAVVEDKKAAAEAKKAETKAAAEAKKAEAAKKIADKKAAAEVKKAEAAKAKQERELAKSRIAPDETITVLVPNNPKREGSDSFKRFAIYKTGMTVKKFLDAGGEMGDINWDLGHRFISLTPASASGVKAQG